MGLCKKGYLKLNHFNCPSSEYCYLFCHCGMILVALFNVLLVGRDFQETKCLQVVRMKKEIRHFFNKTVFKTCELWNVVPYPYILVKVMSLVAH